MVNEFYGDLDEAAARQTLPRVRMSADGEGAREYRVEISWVTEKGGLYDPTSPKNAGRTPAT